MKQIGQLLRILDSFKQGTCPLCISACVAVLLAMAVASTASADITPEQAALGGIQLGDSAAHVRSIYGRGSYLRGSVVYGSNPAYYSYRYNGLSIEFWAETGDVVTIDTWENNGFATPAGVIVGMDSSILNQLYGEADYVSYQPFYPHASDVEKTYVYDITGSDRYKTLMFFVDSNERIKEIRLHWAD